MKAIPLNGHRTLAELVDVVQESVDTPLEVAKQCARLVSDHLEKQSLRGERIEATLEVFEPKLERIEDSQRRQEEAEADARVRLEEAVKAAKTAGAQLGQLSRRQETQDHNLEQVRTLAEALSRKQEELSSEFIERQVLVPVFVELLRHYEVLVSLQYGAESPELGARLEDLLSILKDLFEARGFWIIHPDEGETFAPKKHQAINTVPTEQQELHGKISRTYAAGLATATRVIRPARVEVFSFVATQSTHKPQTKE